jgi:hypothetical protein
MASKSDVQWAAQFLVAAELARRGYTVSFTMGNTTPVADLMAGRPGVQFWIDVKRQSTQSDWLVKPKAEHRNLLYVLVALGKDRSGDRFFVLTQDEANGLEEGYRLARPNNKTTMPGFRFKEALAHEDRWDKLPVSN